MNEIRANKTADDPTWDSRHRGLGTIVNELIGHKGIQLQRKAVAAFVVLSRGGVLKVKDNDAATQASRQRTSQQRVK